MKGEAAHQLIEAAERALAARDFATALALLSQSEAMTGATERTAMLRAAALRASGDLGGALGALDDVLAGQPYHFVALLSKGAILEQAGSGTAAVEVYRNAIKIAPPAERVPPSALRQLESARAVVDQAALALRDHLQTATADLRGDIRGQDLPRFDEAVDIFVGLKRAYVHEPLLLNYPQLPAIPFFDRSHFPWLEDLEAASGDIESEMHAALATASDDELAPYIQYPRGAPVNQWGELNHSRRWTSYFLWKDGACQEGACLQCPRTSAILERLPMCDQPGFAPTAVFSALQAHTHIPPHTGSSNVRLLVHLPLLLPGPARFRVGNETRAWKMGEAWVFDDSIEHEAWNDAASTRVILIFDVWNPLIPAGERQLISRMLAAYKQFQA
ncbi:MAG: aspartyl/asparaginyl beta-hydroxylase domain-containing protein [Caulobacterales bacterium]|nr:aspartyl/asparaginyl beta-hydroxylase domain-containing protein [Caulobacterales bacterium]